MLMARRRKFRLKDPCNSREFYEALALYVDARLVGLSRSEAEQVAREKGIQACETEPSAKHTEASSRPAFSLVREEDIIRQLDNLEEPFSTYLLRLIDDKGLSDVELYKRANIDRRLFSKIKNQVGYMPGKRTVIALAVGLRLSLWDTEGLLKRAGYALSPSKKSDVIVEYLISNECYDIYAINEALHHYGEPILGK